MRVGQAREGIAVTCVGVRELFREAAPGDRIAGRLKLGTGEYRHVHAAVKATLVCGAHPDIT
jgi:hypothetical protein